MPQININYFSNVHNYNNCTIYKYDIGGKKKVSNEIFKTYTAVF